MKTFVLIEDFPAVVSWELDADTIQHGRANDGLAFDFGDDEENAELSKQFAEETMTAIRVDVALFRDGVWLHDSINGVWVDRDISTEYREAEAVAHEMLLNNELFCESSSRLCESSNSLCESST